MSNQLVPFIGKVAKGTTKYFLVAVTEHENNSVARVMDLSTKIITTHVRNHSTGHITKYISQNPKKVMRVLGNVSKIVMANK